MVSQDISGVSYYNASAGGPRRLAIGVMAISAFVVAAGLLILAGWLFNIPILTTPFAGQSAVKANAAFCLILCGTALFLTTKPIGKHSRLIAITLATASLLIGAITLGEYYYHTDFAIDQFLVREEYGAFGTSSPGRMAPGAAWSFICLGLALIFMSPEKKYRGAELLALPSLAISSLAMLGYIYGIPGFYSMSNYTHIPFVTAFCIAVLSCGTLVSRPGFLLSEVVSHRGLGSGLARRLLPAAVIVPLILGWLRIQGETMGLFESTMGVGIMMILMICLLALVIIHTSDWLNHIDAEHRLAKRALEQSRKEYKTILEKTPEGFIQIDPAGIVLEWNHQAEVLFGWKRDEVIGQTLSELIIPPQYRDAHAQGLARWRESGEGPLLGKQIEVAALHRDGREFPIELSLVAVKFGDTPTFCAFLREITERKQLSEQLSKARDEAIESNRFKSDFLANMSHEIRTPMNAIIGMTDLLTRTSLTDEQREFTTTIHNSGDALLDLINDILDYSKIEAGKLDLEIVEFEPLTLIEGCAELLANKSRDKKLSLMTFVDPEIPPTVRGDPGRIRQVVINLLSNAVKFTEQGEIVVKASLVAAEGSKLTIRFSVTDTGIGMSKQAMQRLFSPFIQADTSITRRYGGTGLGLSISKRLVELMDGQIEVQSNPGQGSTFSFTMPLERATVDADILRTREDLREIRLLIVHGQLGTSEIIQAYSSSWGIRNTSAVNSVEALSLLRREAAANDPYDIVFVDWGIDGSDAFALAEAVKKSKGLRSTKLVLLSVSDDKETGTNALKRGFSAYLLKPVKQSRLFDCIVTVLDRPGDKQGAMQFTPEHPQRPLANLILVVEDNTVNQKVILLLLRELGLAAHAVANGKQAVEAIARIEYALILMDCQMPEMDGFMATRLIRKAETLTGRHVPIIALTAHAMSSDREKCLAAGMDDYMSKPVSQQKLAAILNRWIPREQLFALTSAQHQSAEGNEEEKSNNEIIAASAPIEFSLLQETYGADAGKELVQVFLSSTAKLLEKIETSMKSKDAPSLQAIAHELKGSCASAYATKMAGLSRDLEHLIHDGDWNEISTKYNQLSVAFNELASYLKDKQIAIGNEPKSGSDNA